MSEKQPEAQRAKVRAPMTYVFLKDVGAGIRFYTEATSMPSTTSSSVAQ